MLCTTLDEVRDRIDRIDDEIVELLAERTRMVTLAAAFKKNKKEVQAEDRVALVIDNVRMYAEQYGADPDMTEKIYRLMIAEFTSLEMKRVVGGA